MSLQSLLSANASPKLVQELYDCNALVAAIMMGNDATSKRLLSESMSSGYILDAVNQSNGYGKTALHAACRQGNGELVTLLLASGANPDLVDDCGDTPLLIAACYGHRELVNQLVAAGADVNHRDEFGNSALTRSIHLSDAAMVKLLLDLGTDTSISVPNQGTPRDISRSVTASKHAAAQQQIQQLLSSKSK